MTYLLRNLLFLGRSCLHQQRQLDHSCSSQPENSQKTSLQHLPWRYKPQKSLLLTTNQKPKNIWEFCPWEGANPEEAPIIRGMEQIPEWLDCFENLKWNKNHGYRRHSKRKMKEQTQVCESV